MHIAARRRAWAIRKRSRGSTEPPARTETSSRSDLAEVRAKAASWVTRSGKWVAAAAGIIAAAAVAAAITRRVRASRRPISGPAREASRRLRKELERYRPRPIPVTLLFVALRTPAFRRALAAGAARMLSGAGSRSEANGGREDAAAIGPAHAAEAEKANANRKAPPEEEGEQKAKQTLDSLKHAPFKRKVRFASDLFGDALRELPSRRGAHPRRRARVLHDPLARAASHHRGRRRRDSRSGGERPQPDPRADRSSSSGQDAAKTIATIMQKASQPSKSIPATVIGVATLAASAPEASSATSSDMMNKIWACRRRRAAESGGRSVAVSVARDGPRNRIPAARLARGVRGALGRRPRRLGDDVGLLLRPPCTRSSRGRSIGLLFALIFRFLPDTRIAWRDVWIGAGITSLLFALGQFLIGLYLGRSSVASVYGGAGSLLIVLLWTYYSGLILFFGAEVTQVFANQWGSGRTLLSTRESGGEVG